MATDRRSPDEFHWINNARTRTSDMLLKLYQLSAPDKPIPDKPIPDKPALENDAFPKLVDAAICLWRSAFLVDKERSRPEGMKQAPNVLYHLVAHNRIGYEQERANMWWFFGFYINTAEERIETACDRMFPEDREAAIKACPKVEAVLRRPKTPSDDVPKPQDRWDRTMDAGTQLTEFLMKQLG